MTPSRKPMRPSRKKAAAFNAKAKKDDGDRIAGTQHSGLGLLAGI